MSVGTHSPNDLSFSQSLGVANPTTRLSSRAWARGIGTTYTYGTGGCLISTNPLFSASGPAISSLNGLHAKSKFLAFGKNHRYVFPVAADPSKSDSPLLLQGKLLLADPSLRDGTFNKSVILLTDHTPDGGASGLILNHPTGKVVGDFLKDAEFTPLKQLSVHEGGPVAHDQLTFSSFWWSQKLGLRWAMRISAADAATHARRPGRIVRAFIGHSGWSAGQLENELRRTSWFPVNPQPDLLGHEHDPALWSALLRQISPLHRILAEAPEDPFLN